MGTHDVTLSSRNRVVFPPICVGCEKPSPEGTISLTILGAASRPVLELASDAVSGSSSSASNNTHNLIENIPICSRCEPKLKWYHRKLKFATYTAWLPGAILFLVPVSPLWLSITVLIAGIVVPPVLSMIYPPAFGGTFLGENATYEFKSKKIAAEFAKLNDVISDPES